MSDRPEPLAEEDLAEWERHLAIAKGGELVVSAHALARFIVSARQPARLARLAAELFREHGLLLSDALHSADVSEANQGLSSGPDGGRYWFARKALSSTIAAFRKGAG